MSDQQAHTGGLDPEPSDRKALYSALGWMGVFGLFVLIVYIAYMPNRNVDTYEIDKAARLEIRTAAEAEQKRLVSSYEWVNQPEGVVRIPVEAAMRLTVAELQAAASHAGADE